MAQCFVPKTKVIKTLCVGITQGRCELWQATLQERLSVLGNNARKGYLVHLNEM